MKRGIVVTVAMAALMGVAVSSAKDEYELRDNSGSALESDPAASKTCRSGPLSKPQVGCAPAPPPSTGNPYQDCVARINQLRRKCQCLPPLKRWKDGEACANQHAKHDGQHGIHKGFNAKICEPQGYAQNECPAWPSAGQIVEGCLQRMWDEGPGKRFSKHGHYVNMSNPSFKRVACGFAKDSNGEVWSVQNFR